MYLQNDEDKKEDKKEEEKVYSAYTYLLPTSCLYSYLVRSIRDSTFDYHNLPELTRQPFLLSSHIH